MMDTIQKGKSMVISTEEIIANLNSMVEADPEAITGLLLGFMVSTNDKLGDHPSCQCGVTEGGDITVRGMGIINGMIGARDDDTGFIAAIVDGDTGLISRFDLTTNLPNVEPEELPE